MSLNLFSMFFMMSSFFGSVLYFTKYNMGNEDQYAMVANLLSGAQIVTLFITPFIMKKGYNRTDSDHNFLCLNPCGYISSLHRMYAVL